VLLGWDSFKRIDVQSAADAVRLIKQAMEVRQGPPQAVMFRLPCGEGNKTQNRSNGIVRETYTHHQAVLKSVVHQKQVIADFSGQAPTVWDARRSTSLIFWERVQPSVLGNHGSVDMSTKKRKPLLPRSKNLFSVQRKRKLHRYQHHQTLYCQHQHPQHR
jgi:hypothetical protein